MTNVNQDAARLYILLPLMSIILGCGGEARETRDVPEVAGQVLEGGTGVLSPFSRTKAEALLRDKLPCLGCHQLGGEGGRIGPDLTGVGARRSVKEIAAMIADPRGAVPATIMPPVPMPESWRTLIVTYLAGELAPTQAAGAAMSAQPVSGGSGADGGALYARYCAACHGTNGGGDGPNARYLPVRPTVHSDSAYMSERHDAALYDAIYAGGAIMGKSNRMPPFGFTLSSEEIGALVRHLRELCRCEGPAWSRD